VPLRKQKGRASRALRIFFATDVHGSDRCFRKFVNAAGAYDADVLILGGDIAGKGLVPVQRQDDSLVAEVRGEQVSVPVAEADQLRSEINMLGFYPVEMDDAEVDRIGRDKPYLEELFRCEITAQIEGWCDLRHRTARTEGALHHHARQRRPARDRRRARAGRADRVPRAHPVRPGARRPGQHRRRHLDAVGTPSASTPRRSWASGSRR